MPASRIDNILQTVAQKASDLIAADLFYAVFYDAKKAELTFPLVLEKGQVLPANRPPWLPRAFDGERLLPDRVIMSREILLFEKNFTVEINAAGLCIWPDERLLQSWMGAPMIVGKEVIGALAVEHWNKASAFGEEGKRLLSAIARQTALALSNARLYDLWLREQEKIMAMEKFSVMSRVAGEFAHRMNNLVGTIPVRVNLAKEALNPADARDVKVLKQLDQIYADSQQLLQAAQKIKETTITRTPEPVYINELVPIAIGRALSFLPGIEDRVIIISNGLAPNLPVIEVERNEILDTLTNIIKNGLDAMPENGSLIVETRLGRLTDQPCIEVVVTDTGKGIPLENLPKIFDLFFTTKPDSLGFGLWKDKVYIQRIGGDIEVRSEVSKGTTFVIKVPIIRE